LQSDVCRCTSLGPDAVSPEELGAADARDAAALEEEAAQEAIHAARSRINGWDGREVALEGDSERHNPNLVPGEEKKKALDCQEET